MSDTRFALIPLGELAPNAYNARRFDENMTPARRARFAELVQSIREKGIIEPVLVRPILSGSYEVIAGERRYRAAVEVQLAEVPCMVREVNDDEAFDLMVIENLQREDLTPLETAQAFRAYLERYGNTADALSEISARTGIPSHAIRRQVRLLDLPAEILAAWREGILTQSHVEKFTGIADRAQMLELLAACQRHKLSTRELAERIGAICPELERGFFDKIECQTCHFNSAVQSSLFPDGSAAGKCGNAACFEAKQGAFFEANWLKGKAAEKFGTCSFRFGHRLGNEQKEQILSDTAGRCRECEVFVTVLRLNGAVVSGYERVCMGPRNCFEELYRNAPQVLPSAAPEKAEATQPVAAPVEEKRAEAGKIVPLETKAAEAGTNPAKNETKASEKKTPPAPPEEIGPVFNSARGEKYRQSFIKAQLQEKISGAAADDQRILSLALLALATVSLPARKAINDLLGLGINSDTCLVATKIFDDMLSGEVVNALKLAAVTQILEGNGVQPAVRQITAENFGVHVRDWSFTADYLQELSKNEIVRIGEEKDVRIWTDEKVKAYHKERFQHRALMALKKEDLIDLILKSGAELAGRVPAEVLGVKKG